MPIPGRQGAPMSAHCRHRRAQWKATPPKLVPITLDGRELLVPQNLVPAYRRGLIDPREV
nr:MULTISPECIES: 50S ribosomal protein L32 [Streptomyces]